MGEGERQTVLLHTGAEGPGEVSPVCLLPPAPLSTLLGAGTLQHTQVIVLFGHTQLETAKGVVETQGGILSCQGAGEDGHDGVKGSKVRMPAVLRSSIVVVTTAPRMALSVF